MAFILPALGMAVRMKEPTSGVAAGTVARMPTDLVLPRPKRVRGGSGFDDMETGLTITVRRSYDIDIVSNSSVTELNRISMDARRGKYVAEVVVQQQQQLHHQRSRGSNCG